MSLFFRNLRRRLLAQKKFGRYILYALGEIIILIIGILIALSINNWNIEQQNRVKEIWVLQSMRSEIEVDVDDYLNSNFELTRSASYARRVLDHLDNDLPYNDSLPIYFAEIAVFTFNRDFRGAYESLKSLGIGLITNEELRQQINVYYSHKDALLRIENEFQQFPLNAIRSIFSTRFKSHGDWDYSSLDMESSGSMIPLDYQSLKNDVEFIYYLRTYENLARMYVSWIIPPTHEMATELISSIDTELELLDQ